MINGYGPTENTTFSTCFRIDKTYTGDIPIGPPISNSQVYVLDAPDRLAPIGVLGEICVGGDGLALGYWNDPELTASRFIPHPDDPRERIYRTGDLGRWLPCGNLEYHGRRDDQIKIRGFRVEPGEVEAAIREFPGVRDCAVIGKRPRDNANYLIAYLVSRNGATCIDALRDSLQAKLPHYMVPAHFLTLPRFPLTPNGKLDHRVLPLPADANDRMQRAIAPPTCEKERLLVETWKEVLGIDQIGIHDNFFELGGDSILTIKIVARARQRGLTFTPSQMFARQTIAELAAMATTTQSDPLTDNAVGPAPLTPIQHWFFARQLPAPHHFNQAIICEAQQELEPDLVMQVMRRLTNHHDALRLRFDREATWRQTVSDGEELVPFLMRDLSNQPPAEQAVAFRTGVEQLQRSLDLSSGPLLRVVLWRFGSSRPDLLLWIIHHLTVDAVSWQILLDDFQSAYRQMSAGHSVALPAKTTSFRTWANRLESYAQSKELEAEADYWTADCRRRVGRLPVDGPGDHDDNIVSSEAQVEIELPAEQTEMLLRIVPRAYHTKVDDILLTALARCMANWTGENCLLVAVEGHGREDILTDLDLTRTVGWFTAIFPLCLQLAEGQPRGEVLKRAKEQLRQIPNHGIGYGVLRYLSGNGQLVERLESLPQPEVAFNYLGQLDGVFADGALLRSADESVGAAQHPDGRRAFALEVNSWVVNGRLCLSWTYSRNLHQRATIKRVASEFIDELQELIAHCVSPEAGGYTPSDFPDVSIGPEDLHQILTEVAAENDVNCLRGQGLDAICPLTPSQRGMLVASLAAPESGQYIEQFVLDLQGEFEPSLFVGPVQELVDRHAILRTAFVWRTPPFPLQVVLEHTQAPVREHDLTDLPEEQASARMAAFLRTDRMRGFQLTKAPALRMTILRLPENRLRLVITLHHIAIDGWSMAILEDELTRLLRARLRGEPAQLERPLPFSEYTRWLGKQDLQAAKSFWRLELQGFKEPTALGRIVEAGDASPPLNRFRQRETKLSQSATAELADLVKRQHVTQNTLVQGVWGMLLSRYAARTDVTFGVTVSGRPSELPGVERSVGFFNNTVPMRLEISPDANLWEWLREIQKQRGQASRFEYVSGGQIQQWSEMPLTEPLFESVIVFENYPVRASGVAGDEIDLGISESAFEGAHTQYALTVLVIPRKQLEINIVYDAWRWEDSQVELILDQFSSLVPRILTAAEPKVRTILETLAGEPIPRVMRRCGKPGAGQSESHLAPRDDLESSLAVIWAEVLGMERVGVRSNFFDLGGHSLAGVILLARIHDNLGMRLPLSSLIGGNTIERMAEIIRAGESGRRDSFLVPLQTEGTRPPLFCIHPAGGSALCYRDLAMGLGPDQPFYGIQSIGPKRNPTDFLTLEGTAAVYMEAIRSIQPRGPYLLAGWSFGAFCAYEMARQFEQQGESVAFTGLLDIPPELACNEADQDLDYGDLLEELVVDEGVQLSMDYLRQLGPDEQLLYVLQRAKQSNVIAPDSSELQLRELLHGLKVHRQAIGNYRLQPYGGRIVHFRASQGPSAAMDCSQWDELAAGGVETIWVPGFHANMVLRPHVHVLSERIKDCLDQVYRRNLKNN